MSAVRNLLLLLALSVSAAAQQADLDATKSGPASVPAGAEAQYAITVRNNGPDSATNVALDDAIPPGMTFVLAEQLSGPFAACSTPAAGDPGTVHCTFASLAASGSAEFRFTFQIAEGTAAGTPFTNSVTVSSSSTPDPTPGNNTAVAVTTTAQQADLFVTKSGPDTAPAASDVEYLVTATNLGPGDALLVTLDDDIPAGMTFVMAEQVSGPAGVCSTPDPGDSGSIHCDIPALSAGASAEFRFVFQIPDGTPAGTSFTNFATVGSSGSFDPNDENNIAVAATTVPLPPQTDVFVDKSGPSSAGPGTDVTFIITIGNGSIDATSLELQDTLPGDLTFVSLEQTGVPLNCTTPAVGAGGTITCTAGTYPGEGTTTLELVAHVPDETAYGAEYTNTVVVSAANDGNEENNVASTGFLVTSVDVSVTKSGPASVFAGENVTYSIVVANTSANPAFTIQLSDTIPDGATFVSLTQQNGPPASCTQQEEGSIGTITCYLGLGSNQSATFRLVVNAGAGTTLLTNTATVRSEEFDVDLSDNEDSVDTTVVPSADLSVSKSGPASRAAGELITYTISAANGGPSDAENVTLSDLIPAQTTFVSFDQTSGPAFTCDDTVSCTIATLAASETATFELVVRSDPGASGTVENTASISSATHDPDGTDDASTVSTTLVTTANVTVAKSGPASADAGTDVTYILTVTNNGPSNTTAVVLSDPIPAQTTFVSVTQTAGPAFTCNASVECTADTLAAGASATFEMVVHVDPGATGTIENSATVDSAASEPDNDTASTTVTADAVLVVTKSGPETATPGTNATYTISVTNTGPSDASDVTLTDPVPAGASFVSFTQTSGPAFTCDATVSCTADLLAAGESAEFTFIVAVDSSATGTLENTATADSAVSDPASDSTSTPLVADAVLSVTKTGPASAVAGTDVTYTISVSNAGPSDAASTTLTDLVPAQTSFDSFTQTAGPAFTCDDTVNCTITSFPASATATFSYVVHVDPAASGTIENTATADSPDSAPASDATSTTVTSEATLAVTKSAPASAAAGSNVTYTITVTNDGPSDASTVTFSDAVPAQTSFVSFTQTAGPAFTCDDTVACTLAVLPAGASATFEFVVRVDPAASGTIENSATADSANAAPATDTTSTTLTAEATLTVTKNGPASAASGTDVTYTISVTNTGPSDASTVTFTDVVPAQTSFVSFTQTAGPAFTCDNTVNCTLAVLPASSSATFELVVHVDPAASGTIENTATADSAVSAPASDAVSTAVDPDATLVVTKSGPASAVAGTDATYTITVTNNGPSNASNVTLTDAVPAQTSFVSFTQTSGPAFTCDDTVACTLDVLPVSSSATFEFVVRVDTGASGTIENTATADSDDSAPASDTVSTAVNATATLAVTKSGPATAAAGTDVTYTISVTNNGPSDATNVTLTDAVPAQTSFVSFTQTAGPAFTCDNTVACTLAVLPAASSATFEFVVRVSPGASGTVENTATGDSDDSAPASDAVSTAVNATATLAVTKSGPATAAAGTDVTYTITVTNNGPSDASNVTLTDAVPAQTSFVSFTQTAGPAFTCDDTVACTLAVLPAASSATFEFVVGVDAGASGTVENTATADSDDSAPASDAVSTAVNATATLAVAKSGPATAAAGTDVTYTITVTNNGPSDATNVTLTDAVPAQTSFVSFTQTSGPAFTCDNTVACTLAVLPAASSATFEFVVNVDAGASGTIENTATADSDDSAAASDAVSTAVNATATLAVTKNGPATAAAGTDITYTITVTNNGPSDATNVTLTDAVPAQTSFVSFTQTAGPAFTCDDTVACTLAVLPAASSATFEFVVGVDASATGTIENTATADSDDSGPASDAVSTAVNATATLGVTKSGPATAAAGTDVTYTITVTNNGPSDTTNVTLTDAVPAQTSFVSFTQTAGPAFTCDDTVACTLAVLPAASSATFEFVVHVDADATGTVENTATADSDDSAAASDAVSTGVNATATLAVTKSGPATAAAGTDVTYTITVTNNGPSDATNVTLTDAVPAQTSFVSFTQTAGPAFTCDNTVACTLAVLPAASSATFEFVVHVDADATGTIENTATADSDDSAPVSDGATTTVTAQTGLDVTKTGPAAAPAGTDVTYTVSVTNAGPSDAASVTLTDGVPPQTTFVSATQTSGPTFTCDDTITCTIGVLPAGATATFTFVFQIDAGASGNVENTATVTTTSGPGDSSTVTTTVGEAADLTVTKNGPDAVVAGTDVTYTVSVSNAGPSNAHDVVLSDPVPPQTTFVSATQNSGPAFTCNETITCTIDVLPAGATATFTFVFHVRETASGGIANTATVTSSTPDPVPANSAGTVPTDVTDAIVSLSIQKTADALTYPPGATATYTIEVTNDGPQTATGVTVTDPLPEGTTLISATAEQGTCTGTTTITCNVGTLAEDASVTITIAVTLPSTRGPLSNTATVSANEGDPIAADDSSTATVTILASADAAGIPSLSPAALALLALMLAGAAMVVMRR
ncbi:MAG TPA: hypothetical protein VGF28_23185 [Thermoanaerobaculia bacterium]|jgi:uncharacterized repeat protein (TIGR01451 family)